MRFDPGFAPAKVNLTLHVTGQRADGYHLLDSLVVFADVGDYLGVDPSDELTLSVTGPMAHGVPTAGSNLVIKAAQFLTVTGTGHLTLDKNLPSAAGIGGGSSDAAAALRVLSAHWGQRIPKGAEALGADVPVCLSPVAQRMSGIGELLSPVLGLPKLPAVLVNPGVDVPTGAVFSALATKTNAPMPYVIPAFRRVQDCVEWLSQERNDLEAPAIENVPMIQVTLDALAASGAILARMSGSGATCFGIYPTLDAADCAASQLSLNPNWWVAPTVLT